MKKVEVKYLIKDYNSLDNRELVVEVRKRIEKIINRSGIYQGMDGLKIIFGDWLNLYNIMQVIDKRCYDMGYHHEFFESKEHYDSFNNELNDILNKTLNDGKDERDTKGQ